MITEENRCLVPAAGAEGSCTEGSARPTQSLMASSTRKVSALEGINQRTGDGNIVSFRRQLSSEKLNTTRQAPALVEPRTT